MKVVVLEKGKNAPPIVKDIRKVVSPMYMLSAILAT